ncbi:transcription termination/antitermination protein NusG [Agrobacterium vitis]|uniref:transcription termination/antitermination protein NusG n=1 Tax=Agrobacterium vitis TaxID=373 RepID=UPI0012E9226A|nr:transcription termination/antitermination NusG family protein [Agrobacterium vitis]MUZ65320.1 antitermination protein NusG [Agrobacterium vitis]
MMQHNGKLLDGVSDEGLLKLARIEEVEAARRRWLSLASRVVVADSPNLARWVCLRVMTGHEKAVERKLDGANIEALVPTRKGPELRRRGRIIPAIDLPVLIGYVLIRCVLSDVAMAGLKTVEHVIGVLGGWQTPMPIGDDFVNRYKDKALSGGYDYGRPGIVVRKDQVVKINDGPFAGFSGAVVSCPSGPIGDAVVELDFMGRITPVLVPLAILCEV